MGGPNSASYPYDEGIFLYRVQRRGRCMDDEREGTYPVAAQDAEVPRSEWAYD